MNSGSGDQVSIVDDDDIKFRKTQQFQVRFCKNFISLKVVKLLP